MHLVLAIILSYLLGSVPFGLLVTSWVRRVDVREHGSGNTGVTNVLRTAGLWPALVVLTLDVGKAVLVVTLSRWLSSDSILEVAAAISVLVGHNWSVFVKFGGGKGIATGVGALFALSPIAGLVALLVGLPLIVMSRYVSLGSIFGAMSALVSVPALAALAPDVQMSVPSPIYLLYPAVCVPMIMFKHSDNIRRLIGGRERKLGEVVNQDAAQ